MANTIKIKRALNSSSGAPTLAEGELAYNEYKQELYIGKSSSGIHTIGGKEAIQDEAAALITGGSHTGISATYTDGVAGAGVLALAVTSDPVITLGGDLSGSVTLTNLASGTLTATIGSNTVQKAMVNTDLITGQTALAANPDGTNDYVLIYDNSASAFKKIAAKYLGATTIGDLDNVGTGANTETAGNLMVADGDSWEGVAMSGDVLITSAGVTTIQANSVALGTDTTGNFVGVGAVAGVGLSGSLNAEGGTFTVTSNATEANTASTIVARDGSGDFAAGTITAALTGNVTGNVTGTSSIATTVTVADTTDTTCNVGLWESATGNLAPKSDGGLTYNAGTGTLTATAIVGPLTGNVTGDASGSSSSCTGNAATSTKWAATKTIGMTGDVVWTSAGFDGSGNVTATSAIQSDVVGATELGVTAGTATASKALVVDASKDINLGSGDITATNVTGTLQTAAQTNVTSVGDLNGLTIAASQTVSMGSNRITNVTDPTGDQDAATKAYVDAVKTGLDVKGSVRVATTANGTLASAYVNTQSVDGVTLATGDRVLIKNQTTGSENGIYTVNASGAPTRAVDFDSNSEVTGGAFTFVEEGTTNSDSGWVMSNNGAVTVGSTALAFVQFSGAGQITAGSGMTKSGNTLDVIGGTGITVAANSLTIDTAWPGQNTLVTLGTVTSGTWSANAIAVNKGGTGFTGYTAGDIVYASGATAMSKLNKGTAGQIMVMNGGATAPSWTNTLDGGTY